MVKNEQLKFEQSRRQNNVIEKFDNGNKFAHSKYEVLVYILWTSLYMPITTERRNFNKYIKTEITENLMKMKKNIDMLMILFFTSLCTTHYFFNGTQIHVGYI